MSQEYAKSYDQLLDSEVRLVAGGSNGHGSHETIDTDTGNQESREQHWTKLGHS